MIDLDKTVLVVSFHDWKSKRLAGFHKIGEALLEAGYDVGFVSHSRPLCTALFNKNEIHCFKNWIKLMRGKTYSHAGKRLVNFTALNLEMPGPFRKGPMKIVNNWLRRASNFLLALKCKRKFPRVKSIIIESGTSVTAFKSLKSLFPDTPFYYRPSDPCIGSLMKDPFIIDSERELIKFADKVLLVNELGMQLYMDNEYELDEGSVHILPNGIDIESFKEIYACPDALLKKPSACYIGGHVPNWQALFALAALDPDLNIVVICPEKLTAEISADLSRFNNILYIEGIEPQIVPNYVTNTDVVLIPYPDGWADRPLGMHGKVMQAMCAGKPIVGLNLDSSLEKQGVHVTTTVKEFAQTVHRLKNNEPMSYEYDFSNRDWSHFKASFLHCTGL